MEDVVQAVLGQQDDLYIEMIKENLKDRIIIINDEIDDRVLENYIMYIIKWNKNDEEMNIPIESRKNILLILNSCGGEKISGMMLIDAIKNSKTKINCFIISFAASMASYIPMVCNKTYAYPNSIICMHDGSVGVVDSTRKASDQMKFIQNCDKRLDGIILENTKIDKDFLDKIADREYYIFPEEGKDLGIIDYIIGQDCSITDVFNN